MNLASRHALVYAAQFFAFGVTLPFLPAVLSARGLDAAELAAVLAAGSAVRLVAGPFGGYVADALAAPRAVLTISALAAAFACAGFLFAAGFLAMLLVYALLSIATAPLMPLTDAVTLASIRREPFDYGRVRAAGSISFILASILAGQVVAFLGVPSAVPLIMAGFAATAAAALLLPRVTVPMPMPTLGGFAGFVAPLRIVALRWLVLATALIQGSHAFYYAFGTLNWQAEGLGAGTIGALWAAGVAAEITLFLWGRSIVARLGPVRLLLIAAIAGIIRWSLSAVTTEPAALFLLQILHAGTFGAQHLASMVILARIVPPGQAGTAQALHASLGAGLSIGVLTLAAGPLYAAFGGAGYWAMAILCAASLPVCFMLGRALTR